MEEVERAFERMESLIGDHDARLVLQEARSDFVRSIESLDQNARTGNVDSFRRSVHALAGTLSTFGFCGASDECQRLLARPMEVVPDFAHVRRQVLSIASNLQNLPKNTGS